jgi:hypothetical protein
LPDPEKQWVGVTPVYQPVCQFMMIGPPELPQLQTSLRTSKQVALNFGTFTNCTYQLQMTTNLGNGWTSVVAPTVGDGSAKTTSYNLSAATEFFRCTVAY